MTSGFVLPPAGARVSSTARYLRTEGGAVIRVDQPAAGVLLWLCGGCQRHYVCGWPLIREVAIRFTTDIEAWCAALSTALEHARGCRVPAGAVTSSTAPPSVRVEVDALPYRLRAVAELVEQLADDTAALIVAATGRELPPVRVVVTTWAGMHRRLLAEAVAVTRARPSWRGRARFLLDALLYWPDQATALPSADGGVTVLVNAGAVARSGDPVRRVLLHELAHVEQLARPGRRLRAVDALRVALTARRPGAAWSRRMDELLAGEEAEAEDAEGLTWQQVDQVNAAQEAARVVERDEVGR